MFRAASCHAMPFSGFTCRDRLYRTVPCHIFACHGVIVIPCHAMSRFFGENGTRNFLQPLDDYLTCSRLFCAHSWNGWMSLPWARALRRRLARVSPELFDAPFALRFRISIKQTRSTRRHIGVRATMMLMTMPRDERRALVEQAPNMG